MATKQIGKLKLHWSSKGIAWKWGDGEIRRFSFERRRAGDAVQGYDQAYGQDYGSPEDQGQNYDPEYGRSYGGQGGYDDDQEPREVGRYDVLYQSDWVMYALLVLLPPLGIWILWKKERFSPLVRAAVSAASGIWFILLLIWLFSAMFAPGGSDQVTPGLSTQIAIATPAPTIGGLATPTPQPGLDLVNAPPAATPRPGGGGTTTTGNEPSSTGTAGTTYVWAAPTSGVYHKTDTCTAIRADEAESVTRVDIALALQRGQTGCPTCFPESAQSTTMFYIGSGKYYHKGPTCGKQSGLTAVTKQEAERQGKKPCPTCIGNVWATKSGKYYHKKATCSGMANASLITESRAKADGKTKCPVCYPNAAKTATTGTRYYATPKGKNYHTDKTCSGMKNAVQITLEAAKKRKQTPCPICVTAKKTTAGVYYATKPGKYYHVKSDCSGMKNASRISLAQARKNGKTACPVCVSSAATNPAAATAIYYATQPGAYYHKTATCSGMKGAKKVTRAAAEKNGKKPCPVCLESLATQVYATSGGKYYHRKSDCSGMKNASRMPLATAKVRGKTACPVCYPSAAAKNVYYFATKSGKYYHKTASCSGMKNASKLSLASALANGKQPCPTCLKANDRLYYATNAGKHFHLKSTCPGTGMTGGKPLTLAAAKQAGKTACPVCLAKGASAQDAAKVYAYASSGSRYYHKDRVCSGLKNLKKVPLTTAKARGKTACPVCVLKTVKASNLTTAHADKRTVSYASASSAYYHQDPNCVSGLKKTTVAAARRNGKKACPSCAQNLNTYVYVTRSGTKYHRKSTCSGTINAYKISLNTALRLNYVRCTKCNAPRKK